MRKIIQTGVTFTGDLDGKVPGMPLFLIHALCDDGTIWTSDLFSDGKIKWNKLDTSDVTTEKKFGCHCDIETQEPGFKPDGCVIDTGEYHNCIYAKKDMKKENCKYWLEIK